MVNESSLVGDITTLFPASTFVTVCVSSELGDQLGYKEALDSIAQNHPVAGLNSD